MMTYKHTVLKENEKGRFIQGIKGTLVSKQN